MQNETIATRLQNVHKRIIDAAAHSGRAPTEISLLAVSKYKPIEDILAAFEAGQRCFGENYVQEAVKKIQYLTKYPIEWHFIGSIQSNKIPEIADNFSWVHTLNSVKHAKLLNQYRSDKQPKLNVCIQVNISHEQSKGGVQPNELMDLASQILTLPRLRLRGLMAIPKQTNIIEEQLSAAKSLRILFDLLVRRGYPMDTLSMGMSNDLEAAIAEGATIVRVGTDIFGMR